MERQDQEFHFGSKLNLSCLLDIHMELELRGESVLEHALIFGSECYYVVKEITFKN